MHCRQRNSLVPFDEELPFSYAMRKDGGLKGDVGLLIVPVGCRPRKRGLQAGGAAQLVASFGVGTSEDLSVETNNVLRLEVDGLFSCVRQPLTSSVVRLEKPKRFTILRDHFAPHAANPCADAIRRRDQQLTRRQFLDKDLAVRAIAKPFDPMGERHDVAVTDAPDLDDFHSASIHAYIRMSSGIGAEAMAGPTGRVWQRFLRRWIMPSGRDSLG